MIKVRAYKNDTLLLDLGCECHGRSIPTSHENAKSLANSILETIGETELNDFQEFVKSHVSSVKYHEISNLIEMFQGGLI